MIEHLSSQSLRSWYVCAGFTALALLVAAAIFSSKNEEVIAASRFKSCSANEPYLYLTVHDAPQNILKYSRDGCLISTKVLSDGPLGASTELRSLLRGDYRNEPALYVADASSRNSRVLLYLRCKGDKWCYHSDAVSMVKNVGVDHPYGICFDSDGNLYVSFQHTNCVLRYNKDTFVPLQLNPNLRLNSNHIRYYDGTFVQFGQPRENSRNNEGVRSIVRVNETIWIANEYLEGIVKADAATGEIIGIIPVHAPIGLHYNAGLDLVFVGSKSNRFGGMVLAINPESNQFVAEPYRSSNMFHPTGIASHGDILYVCEQVCNCVLQFDITSHDYLGVVVYAIPGMVEQIAIF